MTKSTATIAAVLFSICVLLGAGACEDQRAGRSKGTEIVPTQVSDADMSDTTDTAGSKSSDKPDSGSTSNAAPEQDCRPIKSPEGIPNRREAVMFDGANSQRAVFTRDLFSLFRTHCGACHVDTDLGNFRVHEAGLFSDDTADQADKILSTMSSDDPDEFMPPPDVGGIPYSKRPEGDPIRELYTLLDEWFTAGAPIDLFYVPTEDVQDPGYRLSEEVATSLTNMGNCVPAKTIVGHEAATMDKLDAFFEGLKELPPRLSQTDLTSFDTETLAKQRILSFAPTYPLFSDNAKKMRHVRVPKGMTLAFDVETQQFNVPPNTRLYKTFFKQIYDSEGNERYKKIETRIIVSRPDGPDAPNGDHETRSLFGSYMWNDSETEAFLVTDPLRNGKPFRDRLITYVTDEQKAQEVLDSEPLDKVVALQESGAVRSYAIPGSERCIQCHMGAPNRSFVLGLTPLQMQSRKKGEGGVIDATGDDEMNQLQRFIDYGVVTGIRHKEDVIPLEDSQGTRKARNKFELAAQGYMLGNCAYCHNPRGFPTTQNPELKSLLNFYPTKTDGGVFQFPLDRVSPRIRRGIGQDINIPYISPSLIDFTPAAEAYTQKWYQDGKDGKSAVYLAAPWRSLIYRNVDSPFPYSEDFALFPHMPMNAAGFDCRAPRIFGDWMVSIPAKRIVPPDAPLGPDMKPVVPLEGDVQSQSYVEVKPSDADYLEAEASADKRMAAYHGTFTQQPRDEFTNDYGVDSKGNPKWTTYLAGFRSTLYCPDTSDIVDPMVRGNVLVPLDQSSAGASSLPSLKHDFQTMAKDPKDYIDSIVRYAIQLADGVPDHTHWVVTDITDSPGDWYPRRTDWDKVLVTQDSTTPLDPTQELAVKLLQERKLSDDFRQRVLTKHPYTTWKEKPECDLSAQRTVESYKGEERLRWMDRAYIDRPAPKGSEPVYEQSWGEAVYNEICVNCHGPNYDSRGRQADTLMIMTGGDTRVANFKAGLFGPTDNPHANVERIFQPFAKGDVTADDWAARYAAWMGLGGTQRTIPPVIMNVVATLAVFGERRPGTLNLTDNGANMLAIAANLCTQALGMRGTQVISFDVDDGRLATFKPFDSSERGVALLDINADYEMWLDICSYDNKPPVRVLTPRVQAWEQWRHSQTKVTFNIPNSGEEPPSWYFADNYPTNARVGDDRGEVQTGVQPKNLFPWCVMSPPSDPQDALAANDWISKGRKGKPLPFCPQEWLNNADNRMKLADIQAWATRGAINAGFAVFVYLQNLAKLTKEGGHAQPAFDRCELLKK